MRALLPVGLALCLAVPSAAGEETMDLAWKWEEGARFELLTETNSQAESVTTSQGLEPVTELEIEKKKQKNEVEVLEVLEDGRVRLALRWKEIELDQRAPGRRVVLHAFEDARGRPESKAAVVIPALGALQDEFAGLLEATVKVLLLFRVTVELSKTGEVLSARSEGGIFGEGAAKTQTARLARSMIERVIALDDLAQTAAGEMFPQLPAGPSARTARWPARRSFSFLGLTMRGKGAAFVTKFEPDGSVVALGEEMIYELDSKHFAKMLQESLAATDPQMKVTATFGAETRPLVRYAGRFDGAAGHPLEWGVPKLELKLVGNVFVTLGKEKRALRTKVHVTGSTHSTWQRK